MRQTPFQPAFRTVFDSVRFNVFRIALCLFAISTIDDGCIAQAAEPLSASFTVTPALVQFDEAFSQLESSASISTLSTQATDAGPNRAGQKLRDDLETELRVFESLISRLRKDIEVEPSGDVIATVDELIQTIATREGRILDQATRLDQITNPTSWPNELGTPQTEGIRITFEPEDLVDDPGP